MLRAIATESPYSSLPIITRNALSKRVWMRFSTIGTGIADGWRSSSTWARFRGSRRFTEIMIGGHRDEVKELTLSYMVFELATRPVIGQILGVRWAGFVACFVASTALAAPRSSNPAFLGIQMQDITGHGPCMIEAATHDSPAEAAGLRSGDFVVALDGKPIASCSVLLDEITAHAPGDAVQVKVQRQSASLVSKVQLPPRDALLHKVIGKPMVETNLIGVEDGTVYDLSALHGRMAIVGLYNPACVECGSLFTRFLTWARDTARRGGPQALVLAVVPGEPTRDLQTRSEEHTSELQPLA